MIGFTTGSVYRILDSKVGSTVECELFDRAGGDSFMERFTVLNHELVNGLCLGSDEELRIITMLRSEQRLVRLGYDVVFKPGVGYKLLGIDVGEDTIV